MSITSLPSQNEMIGTGNHGRVVNDSDDINSVLKYVNIHKREGKVLLKDILFWEYTVSLRLSKFGNKLIYPSKYWTTDRYAFLRLPKIGNGKTLDSLINGKECPDPGLKMAQCFKMMGSIFKQLTYIEEAQLLHRDLKPENILIRNSPDNSSEIEYFLSDWGCASIKPILNRPIAFDGTPLFASLSTHEGYWKSDSDYESLAYMAIYFLLEKKLPWNYMVEHGFVEHTSDNTVYKKKLEFKNDIQYQTEWINNQSSIFSNSLQISKIITKQFEIAFSEDKRKLFYGLLSDPTLFYI